jgi:hypothetical protein
MSARSASSIWRRTLPSLRKPGYRDGERVAHAHRRAAGDEVAEAAVVGGLAADGGDVGGSHVVDVADRRGGEVGRRHAGRRRAMRREPGVGLVGADLGDRPLEGADGEPHPAAVVRGEALARAAQAHVGRAALLRQHVHVRERRLELVGDDAGDDGEIVGDAIEHDQLARRHVRGGQLGRGEDVDAGVGLAQVQRLVRDAGEELVGRDDRDGELRDQRELLLRRRVKAEVVADVGRAGHAAVRQLDQRDVGGVVRRQLVRDHVRLLVVRERAQHEAAAGRKVLIDEGRARRPRQVLRREQAVHREGDRVLEVRGVLVGAVDDGLHRGGAGEAGVERTGALRGQLLGAAELVAIRDTHGLARGRAIAVARRDGDSGDEDRGEARAHGASPYSNGRARLLAFASARLAARDIRILILL